MDLFKKLKSLVGRPAPEPAARPPNSCWNIPPRDTPFQQALYEWSDELPGECAQFPAEGYFLFQRTGKVVVRPGQWAALVGGTNLHRLFSPGTYRLEDLSELPPAIPNGRVQFLSAAEGTYEMDGKECICVQEAPGQRMGVGLVGRLRYRIREPERLEASHFYGLFESLGAFALDAILIRLGQTKGQGVEEFSRNLRAALSADRQALVECVRERGIEVTALEVDEVISFPLPR